MAFFYCHNCQNTFRRRAIMCPVRKRHDANSSSKSEECLSTWQSQAPWWCTLENTLVLLCGLKYIGNRKKKSNERRDRTRRSGAESGPPGLRWVRCHLAASPREQNYWMSVTYSRKQTFLQVSDHHKFVRIAQREEMGKEAANKNCRLLKSPFDCRECILSRLYGNKNNFYY